MLGAILNLFDSCTHTSRVRKVQQLPEDRPDIGMQICLVGVERYLFGCLDSSSCRHQREASQVCRGCRRKSSGHRPWSWMVWIRIVDRHVVLSVKSCMG
jgi:hypothetical protein